jgi:hypothetical protein
MARCPEGKAYVEAHKTTPRPLVTYHLTQLRSYALASTVEDFCAGVVAFRNLRDLALEVRNEAIETANARAAAAGDASRSSAPLPAILQQGEVSDVQQANDAASSTGKRKRKATGTANPSKRSRGSASSRKKS